MLASRWLLALLLVCPLALSERAAADPALRTLQSQHLTLVTDLPADAEVDALPGYFDQAFEQWCAYFGVPAQQHRTWQVRGHLMQSRERFAAAGLISDQVPNFATGYSLHDAVWLFDQTSVYYRRHLLLHEGVHSFMNTILGGAGPAWYAEGMAELLGTHALENGVLTINVIPTDREAASKWGRVEVVQNDFARRRALTLDKVFRLSGTLHGTLEHYGWCWAATTFFDHHPRYQARFRQLPQVLGPVARQVADLNVALDAADIDSAVQKLFAVDRAQLDEDWQLFVANVDYGYDFERMNVEFRPGVPLAGQRSTVNVAADRGWQSSGVALTAGRSYRLRAVGRYQVAGGEKPWLSEPAGITIRYHDGRPLGMLLAALRSDDPQHNRPSGLIRPVEVGLETVLRPTRDATLYLRVNDAPGQLADNAGAAEVTIIAED